MGGVGCIILHYTVQHGFFSPVTWAVIGVGPAGKGAPLNVWVR
jgi:hypothetical protein